MTGHIFLSHSHADKEAADLVLKALEGRGFRCWVAPRDVVAGGSYAGSIVDAIESAHSLVLIYTINCNSSPHVLREVERALHVGINIMPIRFDDSTPSKGLAYLLATVHWLSAVEGSRSDAVAQAVERIVLSLSQTPGPSEVRPVEPLREAVLAQPSSETPGRPFRKPSAFWVAGITGFLFLLGLLWWYLAFNRDSAPTPLETKAPVTVPSVTPRRSAPVAAAVVPTAIPRSPTPTPVEVRTPVQIAEIPSPTPENSAVAVKGSWINVNQQTTAHTTDVNTTTLVLDGNNKFIFTKATKSTFRSGVSRPRGAPSGIQSFSHTTRYTGNVIFANRAMIKIKLLTVDFPVHYPTWVADAKKLEKLEADYVTARAVWTLRRDGENLIDAEESSTVFRPSK